MLSHIFAVLALSSLTLCSPPAPSCILSGDPCPAKSTCHPTTSCGGLCYTPFTPAPVTPCTVGASKQPCSKSEVCTPTEVCATPITAPCGGQCLYTGPATQNQSLPTKACYVGGCECADQAPGVFCSQTETCNGLCAYSTQQSSTCPTQKTTKTLTTTKPPTTTTSTQQQTTTTSTQQQTTTKTTSSHQPHQTCGCGKDCPWGYKCVDEYGEQCQEWWYQQQCKGVCKPW